MKKKVAFLFSSSPYSDLRPLLLVLFMLILLIGAILTNYFITTKTVVNLQQNSLDAANAFRVNGLLQDLVNETNHVDLSIRRRMLANNMQASATGIVDSIGAIRDKHARLKKIVYGGVDDVAWRHLLDHIEARLQMVDQLYAKSQLSPAYNAMVLTSAERQLNDTIYIEALKLQNKLESGLFYNLKIGTELSNTILVLSRGGSIVAILAFALLGTFLIRRLVINNRLIIALRQSKQEAEALAKAKEDFLANMSHEIRNPLHAINGYANLMQQTISAPAAKEQLQHMGQAISVLMTVVDDVLDVAKISEGRLTIVPTLVNVPALCQNIYPLFVQQAATKGLELKFKIDRKVPEWLLIDEARLKQILFNLLGNAIKFTQAGWVQLEVTLLQQLDDVAEVQFEVSDSGIGIDPSNHQSIFNRFEQVKWDNGDRTNSSGTGLGLSIVQGLVQLMDGRISLKSEQGKGANFSVVLPLSVPSTQQQDLTYCRTVETNVFSNAKVLVAEDSAINLALVKNMLLEFGIEPYVANDGKQAVQMVQMHASFDLVLMDLQMPELNGKEAALIIKNHCPQRVPIVAMTANSQPIKQANGEVNLFDDWLQKPFTSAQLHKVLLRFLHTPTVVLPVAKHESIESIEAPAAQNTAAYNLPIGLAKVFLLHFPDMLQQLQGALDERNEEKAKKLAHNMTGALGVLSPSHEIHSLLRDLRMCWETTPTDWQLIADRFKNLKKMAQGEVNAIHHLVSSIEEA